MRRGVVVVLALVVAACGSGSDRSETLASIADDVVIPGFAAAAGAAAALDAAAVGWCSGGPLQPVRAAWFDAVASWHATEPAWAGPVTMERADTAIHYPVTVPAAIEEFLAGHVAGEPIDAATDLASTQRGLGAVEYLVFGRDATPEPARCDLLLALTAAIAAETQSVQEWWAQDWQGEGPYADRLAGRGSQAMTTDDGLGDLVAGIVESLKRTTLGELGPALGLTTLAADPGELNEGPAGAAGDVAAARIAGIDAAYQGGLGALVAARSVEVDAAIAADLDGAGSGLAAAGRPLTVFVTRDEAAAAGLYDTLAELRTLFEADVVSLLDVTVGFSDTDGDTG